MGKNKKYKIKTHGGAKRRFKRTSTGKFLRRKIGINNFRRKKRGEELRKFGRMLPVSKGTQRRLERLMPYA